MNEPKQKFPTEWLISQINFKLELDTLFLDRDGVINELRKNDYVKKWEEFEFRDGIFEFLKIVTPYFKRTIVVTNQRGVGKGLMSEEDLLNIHENMKNTLRENDIMIDKIYYCTALEESDYYRKPNIGMGMLAKKDFPDIDFSKSILIGDSDSDIKFAENLGIKGIKVV